MNRDKTIDRLRDFAMLWVIVVHVLYWGDFFISGYVNLLKSFCLFEMPLFFSSQVLAIVLARRKAILIL